jgi:two-component system sensor histidine kinase KdpD
MEKIRPTPDELLARLHRHEERGHKGMLKIFFGMCAGVGKTYSMLSAAQKAHREGVDIVIGVVETHGRIETMEMTEGLEVISKADIPYRNTMIEEMNIDAILARKPAIVLVDELAHTNAPGSRHPKRWQDVRELLDNGIHVYTTLNVQHLESRAEAVRQITGITVRETVPDSILEEADAIELIDLSPEDLLQRLSEGKVYAPDKSKEAVKNFFRQGNLTALREMALRFTTERVEQDVRNYRREHHIDEPWKFGARLLTAIGPGPYSMQLIRATRRMAFALNAEWLGVVVESANGLTADGKKQLSQNVALARELGAHIITTQDHDVAHGIVRVARQESITHIVMGKPFAQTWIQKIWDQMRGGTLTDRVIQLSQGIDVFVVNSALPRFGVQAQPVWRFTISSSLHEFLWSGLFVIVSVLLGLSSEHLIGYKAVGLLMLFCVSVVPLFAGRVPIILSAIASAMMWNFFFIPPRFTFVISSTDDVMMVGLYVLFAVVSGTLTSRLRMNELLVRSREERMNTLYRFTRMLSLAYTPDDIAKVVERNVFDIFQADCIVLVPATQSEDILKGLGKDEQIFFGDEKERSVAVWAFTNTRPAGRFTNTLPLARGMYIPLITQNGKQGLLGIMFGVNDQLLPDREDLLETLTVQIAGKLERLALHKTERDYAVSKESERLYETLFNSLSHELRTPISAITGAIEHLHDQSIAGDVETRSTLINEIDIASIRLQRLVSNLLDISRLESGKVRPHQDWCDIRDTINSAIDDCSDDIASYQLHIEFAEVLPLVRCDTVLLQQSIVNILHNATKYAPTGSTISILCTVGENIFSNGQTSIMIRLMDEGPGLPIENPEKVLEKFFRAEPSRSGGLGLGLSIAKEFIHLQGGVLRAENRSDRSGACFTILLPITQSTSSVQQ